VGPEGKSVTTVRETALNITFVNRQLKAPAGKPFSIAFENKDSGEPHNMVIKDACGNRVFYGDLVNGPAKTTYLVPALAAGSYPFLCAIHQTEMTGTLIVE
jgi:plastocyanin